MIELRTLGSVSLLGPDGSELQSVLVQPKRVALLVYLTVVSRMGLVQRDPLLGLFWPEHDEARARASLRQALYEFRQELGQEVLVTRGDDDVGLNSEPDSIFTYSISDGTTTLLGGAAITAMSGWRASMSLMALQPLVVGEVTNRTRSGSFGLCVRTMLQAECARGLAGIDCWV